mmetsp:Transcript_6487/g.14676  ORF Transcript_6487/g.14676 Transcript_6487/m.14676 type:complete len:601 (+) Transcript_6487:155-1957(+)
MTTLSSRTMIRRNQSSASVGSSRLSMCIIFCSILLSCIFSDATELFGKSLQFPAASAFAPTAIRSATKAGRRVMFPTHALHSTNSKDIEKEDTKQPHIVILGGGFGGINTALTLPTLPWADTKRGSSGEAIQPKITLIDKSERFVFLPLLYELCVEDASLDEVAPTYKSLLNDGAGFASLTSGLPDLSQALQLFSGETDSSKSDDDGCEVSFLQAQVEGINVKDQQVIVSKSSADDGIETIDYDALIIATGSEISLDAIPGASEYALPFYTVEQALELKRRLKLLDTYLEDGDKTEQQAVNVVVVGGGYSGVELALNLVDRFGSSANDNVQVTLVHRGEQVLQYATEHNRNTGLDRLKAAGVDVMTSTGVSEVLPCGEDDNDGMEEISTLKKHQCVLKLSTKSDDGTSEDKTLPTTLLLWTAGATPTSDRNTGIRNSILPRDVMGHILTSPTLNVPEYPNVFAVGDCSRPKKERYPGTAQVAIQMATVAAWNVYATLAYGKSTDNRKVGGDQGSKLLPFKFLNLGEMMTLGSDDATISTLGGKVELSGPAASWLRRWIYAARMPTVRQGLAAAVDGTGRKLARGAAVGSRRRKSKPVDWK